MAIGAIGVIVPGLPTTPLVLLASYCYYKSSPRLRDWLHKSFFGKYIKDYEKDKSIPLSKKITIITLMAIMTTLSVSLMIDSLIVKIIVSILGLIGCLVVYFIVPTRKH